MDASGIRPKVFTPNGDGKNDAVYLYFANPNNVSVNARVFDVQGAWVAEVTEAGPVPGISLIWRGVDSFGNTVPAGLYIVRVEAEGKSFSGTLVAAR